MNTIESVTELLATANFSDADDRKYWEDKLKELQRKAKTNESNARYFEKMAVYNRF